METLPSVSENSPPTPSTATSDASSSRVHISWAHVILSLIGLGLSAHAWHVHNIVKAGGAAGCGITPTISCDEVLSSKYALVLGIPLGVYGMAYFALVLLMAIGSGKDFSLRKFRLQQLAVTAVGILTSAVLTYISKVIIGIYCLICLRVHAVTTLLFLVSLYFFWKSRRDTIVPAADSSPSSSSS